MRVAVLVKQVPGLGEMEMGEDGRIRRDDGTNEMNPYCRRATAIGVELARTSGGECVVFTLGPTSADDVLREAIAWGATRGVHLCDDAFAGSDTLATARALAAAVRREGPFDLILTGRNSVDADTGQVGPELAQLLGLPILVGVRELVVSDDRTTLRAMCERDDGHAVYTTTLPALLTTAERLCEPAKVPPAGRAAVDPAAIKLVDTTALGAGPWGAQGSPTTVGELRRHEVARDRRRLSGPIATQVEAAVAELNARELLGVRDPGIPGEPVVQPTRHPVPGRTIGVLVEPGRDLLARELLGEAARLASHIGATVTAIVRPGESVGPMAGWGADRALVLEGSDVEQDVARVLAQWCSTTQPWAVLLPATVPGCEIGARVAAALGLGLTGDATALSLTSERLVGWKPAFGGQVVAAITSHSAIQLCTVRPGVLPLRGLRPVLAVPAVEYLFVDAQSPTRLLEAVRNDDVEHLGRAEVVLGVGAGVARESYPLLDELRIALGAELAATRKVTDNGWLPRARQLGVTGRSISPRLYVSVGASGKFNHVLGVRRAGFVLAVNADVAAPIFDAADIGIVGDWREVVPLLAAAVIAAQAANPQPITA